MPAASQPDRLAGAGWARRLDRAVLAYAGFFAVWLLLRLLFFDRFWPLALLNYFAEYYFFPLPLLAAIGLVQRRWRSLLPLALPALTFALMFGAFFWPFRAAGRIAPSFTAMSFNVLGDNHDYAAVAGAVRAASPDLVGFEELGPVNYAGLAAQLGSDYPYRTPPAPAAGVALFSRYPIEAAGQFPLPPRDLTLHALVDVAGRRVHVFVVHLSPNNMLGYPLDQFISLAAERNASRLAETGRLREIIAPIAEPVFLLCDCNLTDTSQAYQTLAAFLADSHREAGWGFGHTLLVATIPFRVQRIDYVWHNAALAAVAARVGAYGGSDHLPIVAQLAFSKRP